MEYGHRTNVKCSNKQRARPFMTEILLICCICIKAPKSVCRVSVNHTIISFLLSSTHSLPSVVALLLLVYTRFFLCVFIRLVSLLIHLYLCWACVYLSLMCQCVWLNDDNNNKIDEQMMIVVAFACKHVFVSNAMIS